MAVGKDANHCAAPLQLLVEALTNVLIAGIDLDVGVLAIQSSSEECLDGHRVR
jgi:hypothetical protein